jgi:Fe(3+) dicitrate transport protein
LFSDITPPAVTINDPNLKDASGYNADLGYRGTFKNYLNFDFSFFILVTTTGYAE